MIEKSYQYENKLCYDFLEMHAKYSGFA